MVFSFFKKTPEVMVARPAAVPRPAKPAEAPPAGAEPAATLDAVSAPPLAPSPPAHGATEAASDAGLSDFVFSESSPDFQIEGEIDPVDALAEEAAVLFANAQDDAARAVLEQGVATHRSGPAERLWQMLFDLYLIGGQRAPFDALALEYAQAFEKSPPGWRENVTASARSADPAVAVVPFKGDLLGGNDTAFVDLQQALARSAALRVDLSKIGGFDAAGCGRLVGLLQQARKARRVVDVLGRDALAARLAARIECGRAEDQGCWLLYLELCLLQGRSAEFEDTAINYAVTFEVSPPSWEPPLVAASMQSPTRTEAAVPAGQPEAAGAYVLQGEIRSARFADLAAHAAALDALIIDCARLVRIDFISAGTLLNVLTTIRRSGKQIVFRHPNHLVAELFGIVGLTAVATLVAGRN